MTDQKAVARVEVVRDPMSASGEHYVVKVFGEFDDGTFHTFRDQAEKRCAEINAAISQTHVPRSEAEALREEIERLKAEHSVGREMLGNDLKISRERVLELEIENQTLRRLAGDLAHSVQDLLSHNSTYTDRTTGDQVTHQANPSKAQEALSAFDQIEKESGRAG